MASTIRGDGTQHWGGKALSLSKGKWLKRALGAAQKRDRSSPCGANDEFLLAATAQNLRKLAKIFPASQQTRKA